MSITGAPDAEGGGPTKVGVAISDVVTGMFGAVGVLAALLGRERADGRPPVAASGSTCRCSAPTLAILVNQAQNAFVSGRRAGPPRQRPPEHRPVRDLRHGRRRDRDRGRVGAAVARGCATRLGLPDLATDPRFATQRRPGGATATSSRRILARGSLPRANERGLAARPRRGRGPGRADQRRRRRLRFAGGGRPRDDRRAGPSGLGRDPPGRASRSRCRRRRRPSARRRRRWARTPTRSSPSSATAPTRSRRCAPARRRLSAERRLRLLAAERPGRATRATPIRTTVAMAGTRTSPGSTGTPAANRIAGSASPPGR